MHKQIFNTVEVTVLVIQRAGNVPFVKAFLQNWGLCTIYFIGPLRLFA